MNELGITGVTAVILTLFVAGFVEALKYLFKREYDKALIILMAGVAGGVAGWLLGLGWLLGVCAGFASSGLISIVKRVGDY